MADSKYIKKVLLEAGRDKAAKFDAKDKTFVDETTRKSFAAWKMLQDKETTKTEEVKVAVIEDKKPMTDKEKIEAFLKQNPEKVEKGAPGQSGLATKVEVYDDDFDDDDEPDDEEDEEEQVIEVKKQPVLRVAKKFSNSASGNTWKLTFEEKVRLFQSMKEDKNRKVVEKVFPVNDYLTKHGIPVPDAVRSYSVLCKMCEKYRDSSWTKNGTGAMCIQLREGILYFIVGTQPYNKSSELNSYWSQRGITPKGIKTVNDLKNAMLQNKAKILEIRNGIDKLLPDSYINPRTGKVEYIGIRIATNPDGTQRNQIAYSSKPLSRIIS